MKKHTKFDLKSQKREAFRLHQEAQVQLSQATIHGLRKIYDRSGRMIRVEVDGKKFFPEIYRDQVRIVFIGKIYKDYSVEQFVQQYSFN